ncbi:cytochrome P450 [Nocardia sp. CA-135953]|uniref:cytochrome P450 n=1 Tax=Nocardia sp. CA-135953 TaxID=3239978 RepID=UPI003D98E792
MDLGEINLLDTDALISGAGDPWFAYLREHAPVYRHPEPNGPGFWVISKHADIRAISRNSKVFSSDLDNGGNVGLTAEEREPLLALDKHLVTMDPPEHTVYRGLIEQAFHRNAVNTMQEPVQEVASAVFDRFLQGDGSEIEMDVVEGLAGVFTMGVLAHVLGVPREDFNQLYHDANVATGFADPELAPDLASANKARQNLQEYGLALARERRASPKNDLMTGLAQAEFEGKHISDERVMSIMLLLLTAGHETTRTAILHGLDRFVEYPEQYAALKDDPSLMPTAVEEILRWSSPLAYFRRATTEDVEIRGQQIPAGSSVTIWFMSGNRDEEVFRDPFQFDITRSPNPHLAFGGGGPHFCLGHGLGRLEITAFLQELTKRVRTIKRAGPTIPLTSNLIRGIKHLELSLELE